MQVLWYEAVKISCVCPCEMHLKVPRCLPVSDAEDGP